METKLQRLFDYQKFEGNSKLAALIADTESRCMQELSDDDLVMVNAAGEGAPFDESSQGFPAPTLSPDLPAATLPSQCYSQFFNKEEKK